MPARSQHRTPVPGPASLDDDAIRLAVRERYGRLAREGGACCEGEAHREGETCCEGGARREGGAHCHEPDSASGEAGAPAAAEVDLSAVARSSLGCGAPIAAAALRQGEVVVDLGSGAGLDVFLAAGRVGPAGRAVGVDMTPEMVAAARAHAARLGVANAEFRLGEIEHLPLPDGFADVVISNCVINLVPDKPRAFAEAYRVLKPGGRLVVSDIVRTGRLPAALETVDAWTACLAGAIAEGDYLDAVRRAGFVDVAIVSRRGYAAAGLASVTVVAAKPGRGGGLAPTS